MRLSVVQFKPGLFGKERNLTVIEEYINSTDTDIIVFPELSTTGYFFLSRDETRSVAEPFDGPSISHFQTLSTRQNKVIVIGFAELGGENIYNSAAILTPDKSMSGCYRKTHLFYRERFCFDEGNKGFFVVNIPELDLNLGTMICYDWRFPEASRTLGLLGADLIVCPSNLVTPVWHLVMPARSIENKVYLAVANRYGTESRNGEDVTFNGISGIWGYNGQIITQAEPVGDTVLTTNIEPAKTRDKSFNEFNDIFKDRRPEYYK